MRKFLLTSLFASATLFLSAQISVGTSHRTTLYETYQPARITLHSGKVIFQKQANVFLKNAALLFKNGQHDMVADMAQIQAVEFADKFFIRMDDKLAEVIDTVGQNRILATTTIDLEAFNNQKINDRIITNIQSGSDHISASSIDTSPMDEQYPLVRTYFLEIEGKIHKLHERTIRLLLPKAKRARLDFYLQMPDFKWENVDYLHKVLELFEK